MVSEVEEGPTEVYLAEKNVAERIRLIDQLEPEDRDALLRVMDSMLSKEKMKRFLEDGLVSAGG